MKKLIALLAMSILLISCGSTEKVENNLEAPIVEAPVAEETVVAEEALSEEEIDAAMDELFDIIPE